MNHLTRLEMLAPAETNLYGSACLYSYYLLGHEAVWLNWLHRRLHKFVTCFIGLLDGSYVRGRSYGVRIGNPLRKVTKFQVKLAFIGAMSMLVIPHECFASPWRIQDQIDNQFVKLSGQSLTRYESLKGQYRGMSGDSDQVVVFRNQLKAELIFENLILVGEFMDARQNLADHGSPISTGVVNTAEFIQTYVGYKTNNVFEDNDELSFKLGRQTMDLGSRRLIASTRFRATENTFTGLRLDWNCDDCNITLFYFFPVFRLPSDASS